MGAMLRFKRETGREVTDIFGEKDEKGNPKCDLSDFCTYIWCCICSASKADGIEFNLSFMDFAASVSPEDTLAVWVAMQKYDAGEAAEGEKKSQ